MNELPNNKKEFDLLMKKIDKNLKEQGIPIKARQLHAVKEISKSLEVKVPIVGEEHAVQGDYSGKSLGAHIKMWYEERYGDKLKVNFRVGDVVILIRKDPYRLRLPQIYGRATLINDVSLRNYPNHAIYVKELKKETLVINVLNCIDGMTTKLAKDLSDGELENIMDFFTKTHKLLTMLEDKERFVYKAKAKSDLKAAVNNILSSNPQPGISKWASLQFVEKVMKGFLKNKLEDIPNTHKLSKLNIMLKNQNIAKIPAEILENIQCNPSVRYDDCSVTLLEAIEAHHASLEILSYLLN